MAVYVDAIIVILKFLAIAVIPQVSAMYIARKFRLTSRVWIYAWWIAASVVMLAVVYWWIILVLIGAIRPAPQS